MTDSKRPTQTPPDALDVEADGTPTDPDRILSMWTVYDRPADYPNDYVARRFEIGGEPSPRATAEIMLARDLDALRAVLAHQGLTCITRSPGDDGQIVETWL